MKYLMVLALISAGIFLAVTKKEQPQSHVPLLPEMASGDLPMPTAEQMERLSLEVKNYPRAVNAALEKAQRELKPFLDRMPEEIKKLERLRKANERLLKSSGN